MARFDPFLLPPTLSFFASPNFDEQNLELFGRLDISVAPAQHMDIVMACDQAAVSPSASSQLRVQRVSVRR